MYQRILVPFDGSPTSRLGLAEAIKLARQTGGRLRVIYEIDELSGATGFETYAVYASEVLEGMRRAGAAILEQAREQAEAAGVPVETEMFQSLGPRLAERVVEQARSWQAELIVIGSHGRRGLARLFMGSDAEQILRQAPVPVLLVRAEHPEENAS